MVKFLEEYEDEGHSAEVVKKVDKLLSEVNSVIKPKQSVRFSPVREKCSVFDSKLGGVPYFPKDMKYPVVRDGENEGRPLYFLAQLNFGKIPHIDGFPEKGMLQFFTGCDNDDVYGADFDDLVRQDSFRVIYHSDIITDERQLITKDYMPLFEEEIKLPFEGEYLLKPKGIEQSCVNPMVDGYGDAVYKAYNKLFGGKLTSFYSVYGNKGLDTVDEELCDTLFEVDYNNDGCRIGGYPSFTQSDPRSSLDQYKRCDVLLFQLDSEGDYGDEIMWGDCGVGNFFINSDDLKKLDFSRVLYTWDCC